MALLENAMARSEQKGEAGKPQAGLGRARRHFNLATRSWEDGGGGETLNGGEETELRKVGIVSAGFARGGGFAMAGGIAEVGLHPGSRDDDVAAARSAIGVRGLDPTGPLAVSQGANSTVASPEWHSLTQAIHARHAEQGGVRQAAWMAFDPNAMPPGFAQAACLMARLELGKEEAARRASEAFGKALACGKEVPWWVASLHPSVKGREDAAIVPRDIPFIDMRRGSPTLAAYGWEADGEDGFTKDDARIVAYAQTEDFGVQVRESKDGAWRGFGDGYSFETALGVGEALLAVREWGDAARVAVATFGKNLGDPDAVLDVAETHGPSGVGAGRVHLARASVVTDDAAWLLGHGVRWIGSRARVGGEEAEPLCLSQAVGRTQGLGQAWIEYGPATERAIGKAHAALLECTFLDALLRNMAEYVTDRCLHYACDRSGERGAAAQMDARKVFKAGKRMLDEIASAARAAGPIGLEEARELFIRAAPPGLDFQRDGEDRRAEKVGKGLDQAGAYRDWLPFNSHVWVDLLGSSIDLAQYSLGEHAKKPEGGRAHKKSRGRRAG